MSQGWGDHRAVVDPVAWSAREAQQELWMAEQVGKLQVPVMLGVGAGLEWAYRAVTGGRRVFFRNVRCVSKAAMIIAREAWRERR